MADVVSGVRVVCFALSREAGPYLNRLPTPHVVITGVGSVATRAALNNLAHLPIASVTVAGFCGALTDTSKIADVLQFGEVIDESASVYSISDRGPRLLTSSALIGDPSEKRRLAQKYGADAVDMESVHAVKWCRERGIPVKVIRSISDEVETRLSPRLLKLLSGGSPSIWKVIGQLIRSPVLLPELIRLARHTSRAAESLGEALTSPQLTLAPVPVSSGSPAKS